MADDIFSNFDKLKKNDLPPPNDFTIEIGRLIRAAREDKGLTQTAIAEKISRSQVTISEIENGKVEVSFLTLMLFCIILQKPISYFVPDFVLKNLIVEAKTKEEQEGLRLLHHIGWMGEIELALQLLKVLADHAEKEHEETIPR